MRPLFEDMGIEKNKVWEAAKAAEHVLGCWTSHFDVEPYEINAGDCEIFAGAVQEAAVSSDYLEVTGCEFGGYEVFHDTWGGHVWLYDYNTGLHHDAEATGGVEDWKDLPLYRRRRLQAIIEEEVEAFVDEVADINQGLCADFATVVAERAKAEGLPVEVTSDLDVDYEGPVVHSWIRLGPHHFDAEAPAGAADWRHLQCFSQ